MKDHLLVRQVCSGGGSQFCDQQPHATICVVDGSDFRCACMNGYKPVGRNASSACEDIDECNTGQNECHVKIADSVCVNTDGSYQCVCDKYRRLNGTSCEDINECLQNNGGCGRNSDCYNQIGAPLLCKCWEGYDGNNDEPQADCIDVDECSQDGVENLCPENATCVNTIGSYRCTCNSGYVMADDSRCELVDLCSTQTNECDPYFANCIQTGSTATCQCKPFFTGSGKAGDCIPTAGHEHLACALREITCSPYEQCVRNVAAETYSCESKGTMQQLQVFFSQGGSSETPFWIWTVVVLGALMICVGITAVARRMLRKTQETPEENAVTTDSVYAYSYGAMDYYS